MAVTPYIGEIMLFAGNFPPRGWFDCRGQLVPISGYAALFAVIGTFYGGDGVQTFRLPDLQGQMPIHAGKGPGLSDYGIGATGGQEHPALFLANLPPHTHSLRADATGSGEASPAFHTLGASATANMYAAGAPTTALNGRSIAIQGGNAPFDNRQPFLAITFCIAYNGVFPSRN